MNLERPSEYWNTQKIETLISLLQQNSKNFVKPMVCSIIDEFGKDPFLILISCLLSLRTRDTTTLPVCRNLFTHLKTPTTMLALSAKEIEKLIYPVGFYRKKALLLRHISQDLIDRFEGKVPSNEHDLLSIKGVGAKTAALVLGEAFDIPAICVDTHVHRISNRLGIVRTKTPAQTEKALKKVLPQQYWIEYNRLLVMWGQNICVPISPWCSLCAVRPLCQRNGVTKSR